MKKIVILTEVFFSVFLTSVSLSQGSGFLIYEQGVATMAMGGAFVALANNPTAVFHNSGGLAWLGGTEATLTNLGEGTYSTTAHLFGISLGYIF